MIHPPPLPQIQPTLLTCFAYFDHCIVFHNQIQSKKYERNTAGQLAIPAPPQIPPTLLTSNEWQLKKVSLILGVMQKRHHNFDKIRVMLFLALKLFLHLNYTK